MNNIFNLQRFSRYFVSDIKRSVWANKYSILTAACMSLIIYIGTIVMGLIFNFSWEGPQLGFRVITLLVAFAAIGIVMPSKCYGFVTDKKLGSDWLLIPVSSLEKTLSMILVSCIVIPTIFIIGYLSLDGIICLFDKTCGESIISALAKTSEIVTALSQGITNPDIDISEIESFAKNPILLLDDVIGSIQIFLLGAIFFKTSKVGKTILSMIALGIAFSTLTSILFSGLLSDPEKLISFTESVMSNLVSIDIITDWLSILVVSIAIFFRIKTLKH
jgi:hypothetical protein